MSDFDELDPRDAARLREAVQALPREVEPAQDLWPGIRAEIALRPAQGHGGPGRGAGRWGGYRWLAAAAALVLITATTTWTLARRSDPAGGATLGTEFASYERSAADLEASLQRHRAGLDPNTLAVLERTLRTIDGAIAEARVALAERPSDPAIQAFVASAYRQKIDFLRRANDVASAIGP